MKTTKNTIFLVKVFLGYCNYHFPDVKKMVTIALIKLPFNNLL